jgi:small conductance mechanosensitive channel
MMMRSAVLRFLLALSLVIPLFAGMAMAQDADAAPALPPEILSPTTDLEELALRLVPLTEPELAAATQAWLEKVKVGTQNVVNAQLELRNAKDKVASDSWRDSVVELTGRRDRMFDRFLAVINAWEKKGGDPAAVAPYRSYRSSIIVEEARSADFRTLLLQALKWTTSRDGGVEFAIRAGVVIGSLIGLVLVARMVRRLFRRVIGRVPNLSKLLQSFLVMLVYWLVMAFGLMIVLSTLGIDISPVFALIGGASFIMAFAFQDTLGNLAAGLMIMINRPFDEGDFVDIAGTAGTVRAVNVVATKVTTPDNQVIVIPNSKVWGNIITNVTSSATRRVDLVFGIGYDDSIETAQRVLEQVVAAHPQVLADPAPVIRVNELADSSVNFVVRPWVVSDDYWAVFWDLTRQVKEAFDAADISIPYPQQDLHVKGGQILPAPTEDRG